MQRVKRTTAVVALPAAPAGGVPGYFAVPNPLGGIPATVPGYEWYNSVQEELVAPIEAAGIVLSDTNSGQLLAALRSAGVFQTIISLTVGLNTLTKANCGQLFTIGAATTATAALPAASTCYAGTRLQFVSNSTGTLTLNRIGTDNIYFSSTFVSGVVLYNGDTLTLESNGINAWIAVAGSVQSGYANSSAFGAGQSYRDMTASRVLGTTYYNTTNRPMFVMVLMLNTIVNAIVLWNVGGITLSGFSLATATGTYYPQWFVVPAGSSYSCSMNGAPTLNTWAELY